MTILDLHHKLANGVGKPIVIATLPETEDSHFKFEILSGVLVSAQSWSSNSIELNYGAAKPFVWLNWTHSPITVTLDGEVLSW